MNTVTHPKVELLATGNNLVVKQMRANAGELLPMHHASVESVLFIHEGECMLNLGGDEKHLEAGEAIIIPPEVKHQIKVLTDFKGVHFMPKDIRFVFYHQ